MVSAINKNKFFFNDINNKEKSIVILLTIADYLFKFLIIGQAGTGKSCLLHHFIESKCECNLNFLQMFVRCFFLCVPGTGTFYTITPTQGHAFSLI